MISEEDYELLKEREMHLNALAETHEWQVLLDYTQEFREKQRQRILNGNIDDHDEYLRVTHHLRGVEWVLGLPAYTNELVREYRNAMAELA